MKRQIRLMCLAVVGVLLLLLTACSDMPTITQPEENLPGIKLSQGGKEVDSVLVNVIVIFRVTLPEEEGNPISYNWNFGDSVADTTNVPQVEHRYVVAGNYVVQVVVTWADGSQITYSRNIRVYTALIPPPPVDDILVLMSSSQENSGKWTYRLGLSTQAYSNGSGGNPFITGEPGGVIINNPVNNTDYSWVQLVNNQQDDWLIVEVTCWDQSDLFINYGGNFIYGADPSQWNWADISDSDFYVSNAPDPGGNLRFALRAGQLLPHGGGGQLPGLLGDMPPATLRITALTDSIRLFFNLDRLENFNGGAWVEYMSPTHEIIHQSLPLSSFSGWGEIDIPLSALADDPVRVRYGHLDDELADMSGSEFWIPTDGWLEFYLQSINSKGGKSSGWRMLPVAQIK